MERKRLGKAQTEHQIEDALDLAAARASELLHEHDDDDVLTLEAPRSRDKSEMRKRGSQRDPFPRILSESPKEGRPSVVASSKPFTPAESLSKSCAGRVRRAVGLGRDGVGARA